MQQDFGPYLEIARIQSEMNKLFDALTEARSDPDSSGTWVPSVDVCQTARGLILRCDVPGVPREKLRLAARGGALVISGERPRQRPTSQKKVQFTCVERTTGTFRRVIPLPTSINTRDAQAALAAGVLEVFFPSVSNRRGEEVEIPITTPEDR